MAGYRLAAIDVDGTLTDSRDRLRPRVREAIQAVVASGRLVVLATGRGPSTLRELVDALACPVGLAMANGAIVSEGLDQPPLCSQLLPVTAAAEAIERCRAVGLEPVVYDDPARSETLRLERETPNLALFVAGNRWRIEPVASLLAWLDHPVMAVVSFGEEAAIRALARDCARAMGDRAAVNPLLHPKYNRWTIDFTAPGTSKATGVARYAAEHGLALDDVVAIGDGLNDLEMMAACGLAVAVGNAMPEVREAAAVVVASNDEDGVAEALERFVLPASKDGGR